MSVEDRKYGLPRIDQIREARARTRFLSVEPLLEDLGRIDLTGIHWVIVGGESGPGARPLRKEWVESIREQCDDAGVDFFFKQWGGVQKGKYGRTLNGRTYDKMPPRTAQPIPTRAERTAITAALDLLAADWPSTPLVRLVPRRWRRYVSSSRTPSIVPTCPASCTRSNTLVPCPSSLLSPTNKGN